jgi:fructose 1,6-bisphosphatase
MFLYHLASGKILSEHSGVAQHIREESAQRYRGKNNSILHVRISSGLTSLPISKAFAYAGCAQGYFTGSTGVPLLKRPTWGYTP